MMAIVLKVTWFGVLGMGIGGLAAIPYSKVAADNAWRSFAIQQKFVDPSTTLEYSMKRQCGKEIVAAAMYSGFIVGAVVSMF